MGTGVVNFIPGEWALGALVSPVDQSSDASNSMAGNHVYFTFGTKLSLIKVNYRGAVTTSNNAKRPKGTGESRLTLRLLVEVAITM